MDQITLCGKVVIHSKLSPLTNQAYPKHNNNIGVDKNPHTIASR